MSNTTKNDTACKQEQNDDKNYEQHADESIDGDQMACKLTRHRKPNIHYTEYLHSETHNSKYEDMYLDKSWIDESIGARVLEYVFTQHSRNKGLK